jgi:hypothetical protein
VRNERACHESQDACSSIRRSGEWPRPGGRYLWAGHIGGSVIARVSVEQASTLGWARYVGSSGHSVGMDSTGFNHIDVGAAEGLGVKVVRVTDYSPNSVAELAVGLLLALNRKIPHAYNRARTTMETAMLHRHYERLIAKARELEPVTTAVAHPCDESSLRGAIEAAENGLIKPILVGPAARIADVVLHLIEQKGMTPAAVGRMLYHESGLLGLSGISNDVRQLLASESPDAALAIDYFCLHVAQAIASLAVSLGGLDGLVFTAGIGENAPQIRQRVVEHLRWSGLAIDVDANQRNAARIEADHSKVRILVVPTDEERMIGIHTLRMLKEPGVRRNGYLS